MISQAFSIAKKDIKTEFRTKEMINAMVIFSLLIILAFKFAFTFYTSDDEALSNPFELKPLVSPILWITFSLAGMFALLFSFSKEKDRGSLYGLMLCPIDRSAIYFGKVISNFLLILLMDIASLIFFALFFSFDYYGNIISIFFVILLGTFSFTIIGTLVSGISVNARSREMLLPILSIPLIIFTVLVPSIIATSKALDGKVVDAIPEFRVLGMFAVIYIAIAYLLFNYVVEE